MVEAGGPKRMRVNTKQVGLSKDMLENVENDEDLGPIIKLHMMIQKVIGKNNQNGAHIKELGSMYRNLKDQIEAV